MHVSNKVRTSFQRTRGTPAAVPNDSIALRHTRVILCERTASTTCWGMLAMVIRSFGLSLVTVVKKKCDVRPSVVCGEDSDRPEKESVLNEACVPSFFVPCCLIAARRKAGGASVCVLLFARRYELEICLDKGGDLTVV